MNDSKAKPNGINEVLLNLYRMSHEMPIHKFQDAALGLIKTLVPFDSSMWGTANLEHGTEMHTVHLHQKSPEMLAGMTVAKTAVWRKLDWPGQIDTEWLS